MNAVAHTEISNPARLKVARTWHVAVAALLAAALVTQLVLTATSDSAEFELPFRLVNLFSFFTIQSNILFCAISITLALRPVRRDGEVWRVLRLDSVLCMTLTGVVFNTVLRGLEDHEGLRAVTDTMFHVIGPALAVIGWALFGPRPRVSGRTVALALIFPIAWCAYTLIRGAMTDWYPYPFIDVLEHGYGRVVANIVGIAALFVLLGLAYWYLDRRLPAAPSAAPAPALATGDR